MTPLPPLPRCFRNCKAAMVALLICALTQKAVEMRLSRASFPSRKLNYPSAKSSGASNNLLILPAKRPLDGQSAQMISTELAPPVSRRPHQRSKVNRNGLKHARLNRIDGEYVQKTFKSLWLSQKGRAVLLHVNWHTFQVYERNTSIISAVGATRKPSFSCGVPDPAD